MTERLPEHEVGSGNVFADIGRPDPETHLVKPQLEAGCRTSSPITSSARLRLRPFWASRSPICPTSSAAVSGVTPWNGSCAS